MPWSKRQKSTAMAACKAHGISDDYRRLMLRQFNNAFYDRHGRPQDEPSSSSAKLTNGDFEQFMGLVERMAGGQVKLPGGGYSAGYWQAKAEDRLQRMRDLVERLAAALEAAELIDGDGAGLARWISRQAKDQRTDQLTDLDYDELHRVINGLRSLARRHGVEWDEPAAAGSADADRGD